MENEPEERFDNNISSMEESKHPADAETKTMNGSTHLQDTHSNGFINKSFMDGDIIDIPAIQVNDISDTLDNDVIVEIKDTKAPVDIEMNTTTLEHDCKEINKEGSINETNLTGHLNGSASFTSLEDLDIPKYYTPHLRSRKGAQIGSENLITDADLLLAATLVQEAMDGQRVKLKTEPRFVRKFLCYLFLTLPSAQVLQKRLELSETFESVSSAKRYRTTIRPFCEEVTVLFAFIFLFAFLSLQCLWWEESYNCFKSTLFRGLLYLALVLNMSLVVFEDPGVKGLGLPYWVTMSVEAVCMSYFVFRLCHHAHWRLWSSTKKDIRNILAIVLIVLTVVDMMTYALVTELTTTHAVRWTRPTRPFLLMIFADGTHLRRAWSNIRRTIREIAHILIMFYFLIAVFSLVGLKMFQNRFDITFADGSPYFKDYYESFWQLYVLVTTCNNPDVMLPAYDKNRWYCLFFTVYIILCLYLMLNILLAVTYNSYRENMKQQIKHSAKEKKNTLNEAFEVIKINVDGNEMVTYRTWSRLLRLAHPGKTKHQIDLLMMVLDTDSTGYISRQQFLSVADLLNVSISEVGERRTWLEAHCTAVYTSRYSVFVKNAVDSIYFSLTFDGVVLANIIFICLDVDKVDWLFYALFSVEIFLKWYAFGTKRYFNRFLNVADVLITLLSLVILILKELDFNKQGDLNVFAVFRIFRIFRCLVHFQRCKIMFDAVVNVSVSIFTYCCILFIVFYFFGVLGMELFAHKFAFLGYDGIFNSSNMTEAQEYCNNTLLKGSLFANSRYCHINFNDIVNAVVVLATLLVGNNWQVIAEGFVMVTSKVSRIYFMCFHICITVVVMNIVTAFILDMFIYEYTFCKKGSIDTKVESTIKNLQLGIDDETGMEIKADENEDSHTKPSTRSAFRRMTTRRRTTGVSKPQLSRYDGIRFHIKKRGWTKTELLLQQLFELEEDGSETEDS